jgi:hypothetical protein
MNWEIVTLEDGRQWYHTLLNERRLSLYDWKSDSVDWVVYDSTGEEVISEGGCGSTEEAMSLAEEAAQ